MTDRSPTHDRSCARSREWVSLRLDGELSELERLLLRRHLARCGSCRAFAADVEGATELMRSAPAEEPSQRRTVRVPALPRPRIRYRIVVAAAVLAAGAGIGSAVGIGGNDSNPVAPPSTPDIALIPTQDQVTPNPVPRPALEPPGSPV
jgi:hypothetical protein